MTAKRSPENIWLSICLLSCGVYPPLYDMTRLRRSPFRFCCRFVLICFIKCSQVLRTYNFPSSVVIQKLYVAKWNYLAKYYGTYVIRYEIFQYQCCFMYAALSPQPRFIDVDERCIPKNKLLKSGHQSMVDVHCKYQEHSTIPFVHMVLHQHSPGVHYPTQR